MKERPILFSGPMVRALLAGTKTQTRRAVKLPHENPLGVWEAFTEDGKGTYTDKACTKPYVGAPITMLWHTRTADTIGCPYGVVGDRLWVLETWANLARMHYRADGERSPGEVWNWRSPIYMPRALCRIVLEVTAIRVERLQEITEASAIAEGCASMPGVRWQSFEEHAAGKPMHDHAARDAYSALWDTINGDGSWDANPWVWVIEFRRCVPPHYSPEPKP